MLVQISAITSGPGQSDPRWPRGPAQLRFRYRKRKSTTQGRASWRSSVADIDATVSCAAIAPSLIPDCRGTCRGPGPRSRSPFAPRIGTGSALRFSPTRPEAVRLLRTVRQTALRRTRSPRYLQSAADRGCRVSSCFIFIHGHNQEWWPGNGIDKLEGKRAMEAAGGKVSWKGTEFPPGWVFFSRSTANLKIHRSATG